MSRRGNCHEIAFMESVFSNVSTNWGNASPATASQSWSAKLELFDDTKMFYNQQRRNSTLDHNGPAAAPTPGIVTGVQRTTEGRPDSAVPIWAPSCQPSAAMRGSSARPSGHKRPMTRGWISLCCGDKGRRVDGPENGDSR